MTTTKQAAERLLRARIAFDRADQERKDTIRAANEAMASIHAELEAAKEAAIAVLDEPGDAKRVAGLGVVRLVSGRAKTEITDQQAVVAWVAANLPDEVEQSVKPATLSALLKSGGVTGDGECIPGMEQTVSAPTLRVELEVAE